MTWISLSLTSCPVGAAHVLTAIRATRPLSIVMAERIDALRAWAAERTVPAG